MKTYTNMEYKILKNILVFRGYKIVQVRQPNRVKMDDINTWCWFKVYAPLNNGNYEWYSWLMLNSLVDTIEKFENEAMKKEEIKNQEIKVTPIERYKNINEFDEAMEALYLEFENVISNNEDFKSEIMNVENKDNESRAEIMQTIFLAHIDQLSPDWVKKNVHKKNKWEYSDLIIKWSRMAEIGKYQLSKVLFLE